MTGQSPTDRRRWGSPERISQSTSCGQKLRALRNLPLAFSLISVALCLPPAFAETGVAEPQAYREDHYRGPVPETLNGTHGLSLEDARKRWEAGDTVFVDVIAHPPRPKNLKEGTIWRDPGREDIPHSVWLADTGYGALAPQTEAYFRNGLETATGGDKAKPIVIYCRDECWMSWNAAKRAQSFGYTRVFWFPGGTDAWASAGLPLEEREPYQGGPGN